jgi:predicted PurR-regulated permease PerM
MNIFSIITGVADAVIGIIVIIVLSVYFSAHGPHVRRWIRQSAPLSQRDRVNYFLDTLDHVVGGYIRGQVTLSAIVGLLVGFGMFVLFHLPFAVLLGLLAFVLEFVPFLGVIISGAACVLVALTQGVVVALLVLGYFVIIHLIEAEIVGPRIVGRAIGLHPAVSLIALIADAELFGIWGVLFANPIAGVIQSLVQTYWYEYRRTHPKEFPQEAREGSPAAEREGGEWRRHPSNFKGIFFRWRRPAHP